MKRPTKLEEIVSRAVEKNRELRYHSAGDLRAELKRLKRETDSERVGAGLVPARPATSAPRFEPDAKGRPQGVPLRRLAVVAAAVIVTTSLAFLFQPALPPPRVTGSTQITNDGRNKQGMVTDGSRIYFSSFASPGSSSLYQVPTAGGDSVPVATSLLSPYAVDISPDSSKLLVRSCLGTMQYDCPLWVLPILGGSPRRLGDFLAFSDFPLTAAWSPDAKQIVYGEHSSLHRGAIDGTASTIIASFADNQHPFWLRWSPDGSRLRFSLATTVSNSETGTSLWEVSANGGRPHQLLTGGNGPPSECCGSWTPDGRYFVFDSWRGGTENVWAVREKKSVLRKSSDQPVQLTNGPTSARFPVLSRDGKKLFVTATQARSELVRYEPGSRVFSPYLSGISAICVNFSRDGKWVTYVADPDKTLWRSRVDGSERLQLTSPPLFTLQPRWSPDGSRIAFMGLERGKPWRVYVISADGGKPEQPIPGDHRGSDPNWSPDGNSLLFGHRPIEDPPGSGTLDLEIVDLRTHAVFKLPGSQELWSQRWSPDGSKVVALSRDADRLMLFDVKREESTELARLDAGWPEWSRDGNYVYCEGTLPGEESGGIYRIRISDRKVEKVASLKNVHQTGYAGWVGYTPDSSPLLLHDAATEEIYALDVDFP
jgi:Tol biopolymer transport system component